MMEHGREYAMSWQLQVIREEGGEDRDDGNVKVEDDEMVSCILL